MMPEIMGALCAVLVAAQLAGTSYLTVGGLHFLKLGRLGMSLWISRRTNDA
jgi:hypothetical protein